MRILLIIHLIFICSLANAGCFEYELLGEGEISEENILFVVAKNTQSQVKLLIPLEFQDLFTPYINRTAKTRLILDRDRVDFTTKVVKALTIGYETPDPLNLSSKTSMKKIGEVKCPKS